MGRKRPRSSSGATSGSTRSPTNNNNINDDDERGAADEDRNTNRILLEHSHGTTTITTEPQGPVVQPLRQGNSQTAATTAATTTATTETATKPSTCSVPDCSVPAAVRIRNRSQPHTRTNNILSSTAEVVVPLCLLHYYTSDQVRLVPSHCVEAIPDATALQLPDAQRLFAKVFVDLQQRLLRAATSDSSNDGGGSGSAKRKRIRPSSTSRVDPDDPLAVLHDLHTRNRTTKDRAPRKLLSRSRPPTDGANKTGGGFLRPETIPERLLRTQFEQAQYHERLQRRLDRAAAHGAAAAAAAVATTTGRETTRTTQKPPPGAVRPLSLTARRKPSRRSVWNAVLEEEEDGDPTTAATRNGTKPAGDGSAPRPEAAVVGDEGAAQCPSCGRHSGAAVGTHANRNDAQRKGETWGSKDRADEAWTRYQCHHCGMQWNEDG